MAGVFPRIWRGLFDSPVLEASALRRIVQAFPRTTDPSSARFPFGLHDQGSTLPGLAPAAYIVDRESGEAEVIEPPNQGARRFWSDSQGRLCISE
jgi:hypothetical protein